MVAVIIIMLCLIGALLAFVACIESLVDFARSRRGNRSIRNRSLDELKMRATWFVVFFLITVIIIYACFKAESTEYEETSQTDYKELVSLADNSEVSGELAHRLFYVYVSIDTNEVYTFFYKLDDGGYKRDKVDSNITTIYEVDGVIPHIEEYTLQIKHDINPILEALLTSGSSEEIYYEIYVPKGTVARSYNLDLQ